MEIKQINIGKFGILEAQLVDNLSPGINIFLGKNEAGKSTCLQCLKALFFGYKRKNKFFNPLDATSAKHSHAAMTLKTKDREFICARSQGGILKLSSQEGEFLENNLLEKSLSNITVEMFDTVFTITLQQLMDINSLNEEQVKHALYGAAFGSGLQSPARSMVSLSKKMEDILKQRSGGVINNIVIELSKIEEELKNKEIDLSEYTKLEQEIVETENQIESLKQKKQLITNKNILLNNLLKSWNIWQELKEIDDNLSNIYEQAPVLKNYNQIDSKIFQNNENLILQRKDIEEELQKLIEQQKLTFKKLEEVKSQQSSFDYQEEVQIFIGKNESLTNLKDSLKKVEEDILNYESEITSKLINLPNFWNESTLNAPLKLKELKTELKTNKEYLEKINSELNPAALLLNKSQEEINTSKKELEEINKELLKLESNQISNYEELEEIASDFKLYKENLNLLPILSKKAEEKEQKLKEEIKKIGQDWEISTLSKIALNSKDIKSISQTITQLEQELKETDLEQKIVDLKRLEDEESKLVEQILDEKEFFKNLEEENSNQINLENLNSLKHSLKIIMDDESTQKSSASKNNSRHKVLSFVSLLSLILSTSLSFFLIKSNFVDYVWESLTSWILSIIIILYTKKTKKHYSHAYRQLWEKEYLSFRKVLNEISSESEELKSKVVPSITALKKIESELTNLTTKLDIINNQEKELEKYKNTKIVLQEGLNKAQEKFDNLKIELLNKKELWQTKLNNLGIPASTTPKMVDEYFNNSAAIDTLKFVWKEELENIKNQAKPILDYYNKAMELSFFNSLLSRKDFSRILDNSFLVKEDLEQIKQAIAELESTLGNFTIIKNNSLKKSELETKIKERKGILAKQESNYNSILEDVKALKIEKENILKNISNWLISNHLIESAETKEIEYLISNKIELLLDEMINTQKIISLKDSALAQNKIQLKTIALAVEESIKLSQKLGKPEALKDLNSLTSKAEQIDEILKFIKNLSIIIKEDIEKQSTLKALLQQNEQESIRLKELQSKLLNITESLKGMYTALKVSNQIEFEGLKNLYAVMLKSEQSKSILLGKLKENIPQELSYEDFIDKLKGSSSESLQQSSLESRQYLEGINKSNEEATSRLGGLKEKKLSLEKSTNTTDLRQQEQILLVELDNQVRQWKILALAKSIMEQAKDFFESPAKENVLGLASKYFSFITNGEYLGITANFEKEAFHATHSNGHRHFSVEELSQGTKEQMYLSLRLAYVSNHAKKAESIPLILDDIMVNFDPTRASLTSNLLAEFALSNQVIFFTCHPHFAKIILDSSKALVTDKSNKLLEPKIYQIEKGNIMELDTSSYSW